MTTALFLGRFQPFHNGHLNVIKEALKEVNELIIGITHNNEANKEENPFSADERREMITNTLVHNDITNFKIIVVEDSEDDKEWVENLENKAKFDVVYMSDKNTFGEKWVERCLKEKYTINNIISQCFIK